MSVNLPVLLVYESTEVPVLRPPSPKVYVFLHIVLLVSKVPVVQPKVFVASVIVYDYAFIVTSLMVIPSDFLHGSTTVCTTEKDLLSEVPTPPVDTLKLYV